jgi:hypothetical protein
LSNSSGSIVESATLSLASRGQISLFVNELFPSAAGDFAGTASFAGTTPLVFLGLDGTINNQGEFCFVAR